MKREIETLFDKWYHKQCMEENDIDSSFIYDGSLSDIDLDSHEILFVGRESHDVSVGMKEYFWMKNVVNKAVEGGGKYYNCISMIANYIAENIQLNKCAYMNINKQGGNAKCDFKHLDNYAKRYKEFIISEIEILNPARIVILGKLRDFGACNAEYIFVNYGIKHNVKVYLYDKHPCVYSKDIEKHITYI